MSALYTCTWWELFIMLRLHFSLDVTILCESMWCLFSNLFEKSKNMSLFLLLCIIKLQSHTLFYPHCLPGIWACRRAECRTRNPHFLQSPASLSWHSSPRAQVDACWPSSIYCFSSAAAVKIPRHKVMQLQDLQQLHKRWKWKDYMY